MGTSFSACNSTDTQEREMQRQPFGMMTSSNGNIFRVTGHICEILLYNRQMVVVIYELLRCSCCSPLGENRYETGLL